MKDQPKPTTGVWTPHQVWEIMGTDNGDDGWKRERLVADAHNAALADSEHREQPLVDALIKAADTFTDLEIGLRLLGKRDIAKACQIADEETRKVLAKVKEGK